MGYDNSKMGKKFRRFEPRSFGFGLIVGCLLVSMTYLSIFRTDMDLFSLLNSARTAPTSSTQNRQWLPRLGRERVEVTQEGEQDLGVMNNDKRKVLQEPAYSVDAVKAEVKHQPICDLSQYRSEICDIHGDVRIVGKGSSTVTLVNLPGGGSQPSDSWEIRLYARKADHAVIDRVPKVKVKSLPKDREDEAPACSVTHTVPGVVFATGGYIGNIFHDFADLLIPLFQTTRQFDGQVQFIVANNQTWWLYKYRHILARLTSYPIIDLDYDERVHCFDHAIVGLHADDDLQIDVSSSPRGLSMVDFVELVRSGYSLGRARAGPEPGRRPRLLFISRGGSRRFVNLEEIVPVAEEVGYEVISAEPDFFDVARFAETVNSADVMVGVHGAGLTNMVFLPMDAILIQVVPLAKLDWISEHYYALPAMGMKLQYLQYNITVEESTLIERYPRDHPVFTDPDSIHKGGWQTMGKVYLVEQNVRLDRDRFRGVLEDALRLLRDQEITQTHDQE